MFGEVVVFLLFLVAVYVASTIWENRNLPPGPFPLPVLGNLLSIGQRRPYEDLANLVKTYGKLFRIHMGSRKVIVINSYDIAGDALVKKAEDFAGRPHHFLGNIFGRKCTDIIFQTYSRRWKTQHKIISTALRSAEEKIHVASHAEKLCDIFLFQHGKPFCPRDLLFTSVGNCLLSLIFGQEDDPTDRDVETLIEALHLFAKSLASANLIDTFPIFEYIPLEIIKKVRRAGEDRDEIFERKFREHVSTFQRNEIRDFIDAMLKGFPENGDGLVTEEHLISR